jgi:hypothetical protein
MVMISEAVTPAVDATAAAVAAGDELFDPVLRAVMLCEGVGRDKTIALVLSAVEAAFPG